MTTRQRLAIGLAALALAILTPAVGMAAPVAGDSGHPGVKAPAAGDHAAGEQTWIFDLPNRWDLSLYTLIVFGLLFALLSVYAWPPIMAGMKAREQVILTARDEAQAAQREAEAIRADLQARLAAAQGEVRAMIEEARKDAEALRATEREAGVRDAAAERERAKREIEAAKEQALSEIYQRSVQLASLMSSKAIRRELTPADHGRLLDESLAELAGKV